MPVKTTIYKKYASWCTVAWDHENVNSNKECYENVCEKLRNLGFAQGCNGNAIFVACNVRKTSEKTTRALNSVEGVEICHVDSSKDAADIKLKEYIDNFVDYHHDIDKAELVKIVLLTGDSGFSAFCVDLRKRYSNVRILLVYPEICSRSLLASVDEKLSFSELMKGKQDLKKRSISKWMAAKNKNEMRKVFYGKMIYHIQFPRKMESTVMKKLDLVLGSLAVTRSYSEDGKIDLAVHLSSIPAALHLELKIREYFKNLNNIVRYPESYAIKKILRILLILEEMNTGINPTKIKLEYLDRFKTYVHEDFIGMVIFENAISSVITFVKSTSQLISLKQFNDMLLKYCNISGMILYFDDIIPFSKLIDVLEDKNGVKYIVHKQAKVSPWLIKNLTKVDVFNMKRNPDEKKNSKH